VVLSGFDNQLNVLAEAHGSLFLGLVHSVPDEVLLVRAEPVGALAAPLHKFAKELGSLILLNNIGLATENGDLMIPD